MQIIINFCIDCAHVEAPHSGWRQFMSIAPPSPSFCSHDAHGFIALGRYFAVCFCIPCSDLYHHHRFIMSKYKEYSVASARTKGQRERRKTSHYRWKANKIAISRSLSIVPCFVTLLRSVCLSNRIAVLAQQFLMAIFLWLYGNYIHVFFFAEGNLSIFSVGGFGAICELIYGFNDDEMAK